VKRDKRLKRLTPLARVADAWTQSLPDAGKQRLAGSPERLFGPLAGAHVRELRLEGDRLVAKTPDPMWRKELAKHKGQLLQRAKAVYPQARDILFEP